MYTSSDDEDEDYKEFKQWESRLGIDLLDICDEKVMEVTVISDGLGVYHVRYHAATEVNRMVVTMVDLNESKDAVKKRGRRRGCFYWSPGHTNPLGFLPPGWHVPRAVRVELYVPNKSIKGYVRWNVPPSPHQKKTKKKHKKKKKKKKNIYNDSALWN